MITFECVPMTISYHLYLLGISKVWRMLRHGSVGGVQSKKCYVMFTYFFGNFLFFIKNMCFMIFISLFDEVSIFRNRILTNQKPDLGIKNYQWNVWLLDTYPRLFWLWNNKKFKHIGKRMKNMWFQAYEYY